MRISSVVVAAHFLAAVIASAALVEGTPTLSGPANPIPRFGTLIDFDDQPTGSLLGANQYAGVGVTSITNLLGPQIGYHASSQSDPNYVGTGVANSWNANVLIEFTALQAAVGIGIAGPTNLRFELLDAAMNVLEGYDLRTTPTNTYYYINRAANDSKFLRVAGDFVAFDDLQFDTSTVPGVPEPSTAALTLLGSVGVLVTMRRHRN